MTEVLFNNIKEFKKCMKTITEEEGLLSKRDYILHDNFNNLDYNELNNYNSIELIGKSTVNDNLYCFIYFVNNTSFLSKSYKTTSSNNINKIEEEIKKLYNLTDDIEINLIIVLTQLMKINNYILEKKIIEKINIDNIQIFTFNNLLFNITKHSRVPKLN